MMDACDIDTDAPTCEPCLLEVIVVGGGLAGLVAARNLLRRGLSVLLIEARDRLGGRCLTCPVDNSCSGSGIGKKVDFGDEWFAADRAYQPCVHDEIEHYSLALEERQDAEAPSLDHTIWYYYYKKSLVHTDSPSEIPVYPLEHEIYRSAMQRLQEDAERLRPFSSGHYHIDYDYLDIPFEEYLSNYLKVPSDCATREFLLARVAVLIGGHPSDISAISVLRTITGFRLQPELYLCQRMSRLANGTEALVCAIRDEILSLGGQILMQTAVIRLEDIRSPQKRVEVLTIDNTGHREIYLSQSVIVTIPMACLKSVECKPALPPTVQHALQVCNASNRWKAWVIADGLPNDFNRVCTKALWGYESMRHSRLIQLSALQSVEEADRAIKPVPMYSSLVLHKAVTIASIRGYQLHQSSDTVRIRNGSIRESASFLLSISSPDKSVLTLETVTSYLAVQFPTIKRVSLVAGHDFTHDVWSRSYRMALRAGTAKLFAEACDLALHPWVATSDRFIIAGSDFCNTGWTGWIEGALSSGRDSAADMYLRLHPTPVEKNLLRIIPPVTPNTISSRNARKFADGSLGRK